VTDDASIDLDRGTGDTLNDGSHQNIEKPMADGTRQNPPVNLYRSNYKPYAICYLLPSMDNVPSSDNNLRFIDSPPENPPSVASWETIR